MMEYKMLSRGESSSHAVKKKTKQKSRPTPRTQVKKKPKQLAVESEWGPLYLDAKAFTELEQCIQTPQQPTLSIRQGAELIKQLYHKRR
jgi:hypothetical protein